MKQSKEYDLFTVILAVIGAASILAGIAYAIYRIISPDYLEEYLDDFDEEFEEEYEDFFDDEDVADEDESEADEDESEADE